MPRDAHISARIGKVVGSVEQHTRLVAVDFHGTPRLGVHATRDKGQALGRSRGHAEVVVEAVARRLRNGFAELPCQTEIKTRVADVLEVAGGDLLERNLQDFVRVHRELVLVELLEALIVTGQIEVRMVRHVDDCRFARDSRQIHGERVVVRQFAFARHQHGAWVAFEFVGRHMREINGRAVDVPVPIELVKANDASVQTVLAQKVSRQHVLLAVQLELTVRYTIGHTTHHAADVSRISILKITYITINHHQRIGKKEGERAKYFVINRVSYRRKLSKKLFIDLGLPLFFFFFLSPHSS